MVKLIRKQSSVFMQILVDINSNFSSILKEAKVQKNWIILFTKNREMPQLQIKEEIYQKVYPELKETLYAELHDKLKEEIWNELYSSLSDYINGNFRKEIYELLEGRLSEELYEKLYKTLYDGLYNALFVPEPVEEEEEFLPLI